MSSLQRVLLFVALCHLAGEVQMNIHEATRPEISSEGKMYQFKRYISLKDTVFESPNYPRQYPPDLNLTWELSVSSGNWGLVFTDFDLDLDSESEDTPDVLEIIDRGRNSVKYTAHVQPLLPYVSDGSHLIIQFVSNGFSDNNKRGLQIQVLHGASERDVQIKIHEATKREKSPEDNSSWVLVIITAVLTFLALLVIIVAAVLIRKNSQNSRNENRNVFGIRRNSGISHSRRTRSVYEPPPNDEHAQQPRRADRSVQRSNSHMNWMARAELTNTMQKTGSSRPNAYTSTNGVNVAPASTPAVASGSRVTSPNNNFTRSCDSLNEYSETVDSLNRTPRTSPAMQEAGIDEQPPSYEESHLIPVTYKSDEKPQPGLSDCYENLTPNVRTGRQHLGNETNIYINTIRNSESRGSINEITIDANSCIIKATRGENPDDKPFTNKSAINVDAPATNIVIYQNLSANKQSEREPSQPSSSIQIIDGYAFIVPSSDHVSSYNFVSQPSNVDGGKGSQQLGNSSKSPHGAPDDVQDVLGQRSPGACSDIYINTQET